jgi:hypothetical protein
VGTGTVLYDPNVPRANAPLPQGTDVQHQYAN